MSENPFDHEFEASETPQWRGRCAHCGQTKATHDKAVAMTPTPTEEDLRLAQPVIDRLRIEIVAALNYDERESRWDDARVWERIAGPLLAAFRAEARRERHEHCQFSTGIDDSITAGTGDLDANGFWSQPCDCCTKWANKCEQAREMGCQQEREACERIADDVLRACITNDEREVATTIRNLILSRRLRERA